MTSSVFPENDLFTFEKSHVNKTGVKSVFLHLKFISKYYDRYAVVCVTSYTWSIYHSSELKQTSSFSAVS